MKMFSKRLIFLLVIGLSILLFVAACSNTNHNNNNGNNDNSESDLSNNNEPNNLVNNENDDLDKEPVTLIVASPFGDSPTFENRYLSIDLPDYITLEGVFWDESRDGLEELYSEGILPDIYNSGSVGLLQEYEAIIPIDDLVEKHNYDTSIIQPSLINYLRSFDKDQQLIGVPDGASYYALYYNKEIFDMFGEEYPDPNVPMTWEEVLNLARKMTIERNGVQYYGLEFHNNDFSAPINQFGVNFTDPETGEVLIDQIDGVTQYLEMVQDFFSIPNVDYDEHATTCLFCEKRAAMSVAWHGLWMSGWGDDPSVAMDMDIAPLPVWPDLPNGGPYLLSYPVMISSHTEHKEEAFKVLLGYVSEENQLNMSRKTYAGPTTLFPTVLEEFAAENAFYDDKNISAIFSLEPALGPDQQSKWNGYVNFYEAREKAAKGIDIPTIIREMKEEAEVEIEEAKQKE